MRHVLLTILGLLATTAAFAAPNADSVNDPSAQPAVSAAIPIFRSFVTNIPPNVLSLGVGYGANTGVIWVTDGGVAGGPNTDNVVQIFMPNGTHVMTIPQPATEPFGWRDAGYTGDHFLFGAVAGGANNIYHVNEGTMAVDNIFTVPGGPSPHRGIAVMSKVGNVLTCKSSTFGSPIFDWTWTIGNPTGAISGSCAVAETGVYGLAYDTGRNSLWASTADITGNLHEYTVPGCADKPGSPFSELPELPTQGGAEVFDPGDGCRLWLINQSDPDVAAGLATVGSGNPFGCAGATAVEPSTWGALKARYSD
jgi:hypothetical protein